MNITNTTGAEDALLADLEGETAQGVINIVKRLDEIIERRSQDKRDADAEIERLKQEVTDLRDENQGLRSRLPE